MPRALQRKQQLLLSLTCGHAGKNINRNVALLFNNRKQEIAEVTSLYWLELLQYILQ